MMTNKGMQKIVLRARNVFADVEQHLNAVLGLYPRLDGRQYSLLEADLVDRAVKARIAFYIQQGIEYFRACKYHNISQCCEALMTELISPKIQELPYYAARLAALQCSILLRSILPLITFIAHYNVNNSPPYTGNIAELRAQIQEAHELRKQYIVWFTGPDSSEQYQDDLKQLKKTLTLIEDSLLANELNRLLTPTKLLSFWSGFKSGQSQPVTFIKVNPLGSPQESSVSPNSQEPISPIDQVRTHRGYK